MPLEGSLESTMNVSGGQTLGDLTVSYWQNTGGLLLPTR